MSLIRATGQAVCFVGFELLRGLLDLLSQSRDQLCDMKLLSTEEAEEKVERVHATALSALSRLFQCVSGTASTGSSSISSGDGATFVPHPDLVAAVACESIPAIRKQCGSRYFGVRRSTYNFFAMLTTGSGAQSEYVTGNLLDFTVTVMSFLDEKEPRNHEAMWAAVIAFLRCVRARV